MSDPRPTLTIDEAAARVWDVMIIGAGPAGGAAACALAKAGADVLLLERSRFPRNKVCGCCINGSALKALEELELDEIPATLGARRLDRLRLYAGRRSATVRLARGVALSRAAFDAALVDHAMQAGAHFLSEASATVGGVGAGLRRVSIRHHGRTQAASGRLVLVADGLAGTSLRGTPGMAVTIRRGARMGAAAIIEDGSPAFEAGTIHMACAAHGYVGLVRIEDGRLNVAAALDPLYVKRSGGPRAAVAEVLQSTGQPLPGGIGDAGWSGAGRLTRSRRAIAAERLLVIGDAAGYVEPFTGEGIAWALGAAIEVAGTAQRAVKSWDPTIAQEWTRRHHRLVARRQLTCRMIARTLRSPRMTRAAVAVLALRPALAGPLVRAIQVPRSRPRAVSSSSGRLQT